MAFSALDRRHGRALSYYLTKYVMKEVFFSFLSGTLIFLFILLMFQAIRLSEFVVIHHVSVKDIARLCYYLLVSFVPIAVPIAFLFAILMGISRANSEGEILALQVNGISVPQIFLPVFILSILVSLGCLYASLYTVPQGNRNFELLFTKLQSERVVEALKPGVFNTGFHGLTLFAEEIIPVKNEMKRVFIFDEREEAHPLAITAQAGILKRVPEQGMLTLRLSDGSIHEDKNDVDEALLKIDFDVYDINLTLEEGGNSWRAASPPSFTYPQLQTRLIETIPDPPAHRGLEVELHRRFSLSFSCAVFAALGFFIGILSQRGVRSSAILVCMLVGMIYWLSILAANALASRGSFAPWIGVWLPNFIFGFVAYLCYRRYRAV